MIIPQSRFFCRIQELVEEKVHIQEYLAHVRLLAETKIEGFTKTTKCSEDLGASPNLTEEEPTATGDVDVPGSGGVLENIGDIISKMAELECFLGGDESFENFMQVNETA